VQLTNAWLPIIVTLLGMTTLVTEVLGLPKIGWLAYPTFVTAYSPNTLGIVTAPIAVDAIIVTPTSLPM
jgi:hypothetical protein